MQQVSKMRNAVPICDVNVAVAFVVLDDNPSVQSSLLDCQHNLWNDNRSSSSSSSSNNSNNI